MKVLYKVLTSGILVLSLTGCRIDELEGLVDSYAGAGLFDPQLRWSAQQYDITIGETGSFPSLTNEYGVNVTYTSSDENVASIADNGEITILAGGRTTITASSEKTKRYDASSASYTLTVHKAEPKLTWSEDRYKATMAGENIFPTLTADEGLTIRYTSSDEDIAKIDNTGKITLLAKGTTVITAESEETHLYKPASASYSLVVSRSGAGIAWSESSCSAVLGQTNTLPVLNNPNGLEISYGSSNEAVAEIDADGSVKLIGTGTSVITAYSASTDSFEADEDSYTLTVIDGTAGSKTDAGLQWSKTAYELIYGESEDFPILSNPNGLSVAYSSTNESVAVISAEGKVSIISAGTTTIIAHSDETDRYSECSVFYKLTIQKGEVPLTWSSSSCTVTYGEEMSLPTLNNPMSLPVTYNTSNSDVASITSDGQVILVGSGSTSISASVAATDLYEAQTAVYTLTVNKGMVHLEWSKESFTAILGGTDSFPTLLTSPEGLDVSYSSSDESVAGISSDGTITLVSAGRTTITASFAGNRLYDASDASYVLTVSAGGDEGAGTYNYPSTGDSSSIDDIVNTTFTRKITIIYSTSTDAVIIGDYYGYVTVSGNDVTVNNTGTEYIVYELQGTTNDGYLKMYGTVRQALLMNNVNISNKSGAAINIQNRKRTFVMVEGTNTLSDGSSYTETPAAEDEKAAFFSEGQLIFSGSGSLSVTASGKSGITSDDYIRVMNNPQINSSSSAGHALRGQKSIQIDAGTINAQTSADMKKGFSSDSLVVFNGGTTEIAVTGGTAYDSEDADYTSSAGIKADKLFYMNDGSLTITNSGAGGKGINVGSSDTTNDCKAYFTGGTIDITCSGAYYTTGESGAKGIKVGKKFSSSSYTGDMYVSGGVITVRSIGSNSSRDSGNEAVESKGVLDVSGGELFAYSTSDDAINSADDFTITDGYVCGISTGNDGLDANGNFYVKGGVVMAASAGSPEVGIDVNSEGGKKLYVSGGVLFVTGGLESGASLTQSCYKASSFTKGVWYSLTVGSKTYAFKTHSTAAGSTLVVSGQETPTLKSGITVSGGATYFDGYANRDGSYSGGNSVSLSAYSGSSSGGSGRPW